MFLRCVCQGAIKNYNTLLYVLKVYHNHVYNASQKWYNQPNGSNFVSDMEAQCKLLDKKQEKKSNISVPR